MTIEVKETDQVMGEMVTYMVERMLAQLHRVHPKESVDRMSNSELLEIMAGLVAASFLCNRPIKRGSQ